MTSFMLCVLIILFQYEYIYIISAQCTNGDLELVSPGNDRGHLIICVNSRKYQLCSTGFNEDNARVACRQLGFVEGNLMIPSVKDTNYSVLNISFKCDSHDTSLTNGGCLNMTLSHCASNNTARIHCYNNYLSFVSLRNSFSYINQNIFSTEYMFILPHIIPVGSDSFRKGYIYPSGVISFGHIPLTHNEIINIPEFNYEQDPYNVIAPFLDPLQSLIFEGGIFFTTNTNSDSYPFTVVDRFITNSGTNNSFRANVLLLVKWQGEETIKFQSIIASDLQTTYAIFTYYCDTGLRLVPSSAFIGYSLSNYSSEASCFSETPFFQEIACLNTDAGVNYYNLLYKLTGNIDDTTGRLSYDEQSEHMKVSNNCSIQSSNSTSIHPPTSTLYSTTQTQYLPHPMESSSTLLTEISSSAVTPILTNHERPSIIISVTIIFGFFAIAFTIISLAIVKQVCKRKLFNVIKREHQLSSTMRSNLESAQSIDSVNTIPSVRYISQCTTSISMMSIANSNQAELINTNMHQFEGLIVEYSHLRLLDIIGEGEFGLVYKAHLFDDQGMLIDVAVKTLKGSYNLEDIDNFLVESLKMKKFNHLNVMSLIGVCLDAGPAPYIILPYMAGGSLLSYLKRNRKTLVLKGDEEDEGQKIEIKLLSMSLQIAKGMEYITSKNMIHRDLAARNCMIDHEGVIKVSDFGLSKNLYEKMYFRQEKGVSIKLPMKWMAIESIDDGIFSEKSDVWSFGVTCWEIFSGGKGPYGGISPLTLPDLLEEGHRMNKPINNACSESTYELLMSKCWDVSPEKRPTFSDLAKSIENTLTSMADYLDLNQFTLD